MHLARRCASVYSNCLINFENLWRDSVYDLLEIDMIRSTLDTQYGADANVIRREAARLCITMPTLVDSKYEDTGVTVKTQ